MRNITILGFLVVLVLFGTSKIYAQCSCAHAGESESDEIKRSEAAFIGEVVKVVKTEPDKKSEYKEFDVTFKVVKSLKDDSLQTITIKNITSDSADFEEKESYIVFAVKYDNKLLAWIGCCTRTRKIPPAEKK